MPQSFPVSSINTQNVDGLHHKAFSLSKIGPVQQAILELHGTLRVRTLSHLLDRPLDLPAYALTS
ncbi:hypothetical protein ARMSODRAFT_962569 [Armillaria solidipes]|uniref:Uncharacterized protein n=1 Tax=Armillaria solidipes TaxID=1076256 RepID=A0A2H3AZG2_9AGAR|nr:hypothetical protein ARMSODRAFT_962569 [Armillaria solidipes]